MRLLLVEDDANITAFVMKGLRQEGFAVDHAANGMAGLELALTVPYDAAVIDLMLPQVDVLVCRLRTKVDRDFPVKMIHTLRGIRYVLKVP